MWCCAAAAAGAEPILPRIACQNSTTGEGNVRGRGEHTQPWTKPASRQPCRCALFRHPPSRIAGLEITGSNRAQNGRTSRWWQDHSPVAGSPIRPVSQSLPMWRRAVPPVAAFTRRENPSPPGGCGGAATDRAARRRSRDFHRRGVARWCGVGSGAYGDHDPPLGPCSRKRGPFVRTVALWSGRKCRETADIRDGAAVLLVEVERRWPLCTVVCFAR
jgi:hypothetical protein